MRKSKLVLLCGAGFPIMWGSPTSDFLTETIKKYIREGLSNNECAVLIIIGYSFSDPHINMLIKEYTSFDKPKVLVIDKLSNVYGSSLFNKLIQLIPIQSQYTPDNSSDDWFSYNNSTVKVYKRGCENLFNHTTFIDNL